MVTSKQKPTVGTKTQQQKEADYKAEIKRLKIELAKSNSQAVTQKAEERVVQRVSADDYIEVISLCPMQLVLTTEPKGRGFSYTWNRYGESMLIVYADLQNVIKNHGSGLYTDFIREGYVYINNPEVVKKSGLSQVYEKILTKEEMDIVLECSSDEGVKLFKSTIRSQQMFVATMLIDRIANGEQVDLNYLFQYSQTIGTDIAKHAEEAKSYLALNLKRE